MPTVSMTVPPLVFICYARADNESPDPNERWLDRIRVTLNPLERRGLITIWTDQNTEIGVAWDQTIKQKLEQARAAVLLVSPSFMGSQYIYEQELPILLKRAKEEGLIVLPVILRKSDLKAPFFYIDEADQRQEFRLSSLQVPNWGNKPLNAMSQAEQDETLQKIYVRLKEIVENPR